MAMAFFFPIFFKTTCHTGKQRKALAWRKAGKISLKVDNNEYNYEFINSVECIFVIDFILHEHFDVIHTLAYNIAYNNA